MSPEEPPRRPSPVPPPIATVGPADTARWIPPVLATLAAAVVATSAVAGPSATAREIGIALLNALLGCAVLAPLAWWAARGRLRATVRSYGVVALFVVVSWCALTLPRAGPFADLDWNWQGKLIDLAWLLVLFGVLREWAITDVGLRWRALPGSLRPVLVVIVVWFASATALAALGAAAGSPAAVVTPERVLFDATYPNLTEELLWRGAALALLDRALGTPWTFVGARVGWGLVLTTAAFGLGHGLVMTESGLTFDPASIVLTGLAGLVIGWVRARSGIIWPAFLAHCAPELGLSAGTILGQAW